MAIVLVFAVLIQALAVFLLGTIIFDLFHYLLHRSMRSKNNFLRLLGRFHAIHHHFFPATLKINSEWEKRNLKYHVTFEYLTQVFVTLLCLSVVNHAAILIALILETIIFAYVCYVRGQDPHHRSYDVLPVDRGGIFVSAPYHALHHVYPNQFYSSYIKLVDWVFGTGCQLQGKRIVMTGANGALGSHLRRLLERAGASVIPLKFGVDYTYESYDKAAELLANADILCLCHGSKYDFAQQANCDSFIQLIDIFRANHSRGLIPREVWATGSEIECHPCFGIEKIKVYAASKRNFARAARRYYYDDHIQYRHLVHSAFTSRMGYGLMTANMAAYLTLFLIKRGFKYVPVTYTGFAFLNYFRYLFRPAAASQD